MTVLVTGAAGSIGSVLRERLPALGWAVRGADRVAGPGVDVVGDLTDPGILGRALSGVEAVVHLAGQPTEAPWPVIRDANVEGLWQLFEAVRAAGIQRVVWASSNHAVGFTPEADDLPADLAPRPDTLYGVSKVFGEALARYYVDRYGLQVACLRIGTFAPRPLHVRSLSTWLSPGDAVRLVDAALRCADLTYALVWGISANTRRTWSAGAGHAIGYHPIDDAEDYAGDLPDAHPHPSDVFVGGGFTDIGFGQDEVAARWT